MSCFDVKILDPNINTIEIETCIGDQPASIDVITYDNTSTVEINHCVALLPSEINDLITVKDIIAGSGISVSDSSGIYTVSLSNPTISSSGIVDFLESVQDVIGNSGLVGGNYININYDDNTGLTTVSATGLQPSGNYSIVGHNHISTDITDFNSAVSGLLPVKNISAGSGIGITSISGDFTVSVTGTFGLTSEEVDDRVSSLLVAGNYINLNYNDLGNSLTISVTGVQPSGNYSAVGHSHVSSEITDFNTAVSGLLPPAHDAAVPWTENHTLVDGTRYLVNDLVYESGYLYRANYDNESIPVSDPLYWTNVGPGYRLNIDGRDIPNIPYPVTSVNSQTGDVNITSIDISDFNSAVSGLIPPSNFTSLSGINGIDVSNSGTDYTVALASSGNFTNLTVNNIDVSVSGHNHVYTDITNFASGVDAALSTALIAGTGIYLYEDTLADTLSINVTGVSMVGHNHTSSDITNFQNTVISNIWNGVIPLNSGVPVVTAGFANGSGIIPGSFGTASGTFCEGNDPRLSDARTPLSHTHTASEITDFNSSVSGLLPYQVYTSGNASNSIIPISGTNFNSGINSTIGGGTLHTISNDNSFIGGGTNNNITSINSVVVGGSGNWGGGNYSFVGGGYDVEALGDYGITVGGSSNNNSGNYGVIIGGSNNTLAGDYSAILGGQLNSDGGYDNVFILGSNLLATQANATYTENLISQSGNFTALSVNTTGVSLIGHTHTSSNITDFNSSVSGLIPVKNIVGGSGIDVSSLSGTYTIAVTGISGLISEEVDDRVSSLLIAGTGVNLTYNDPSGTLTIDNLHTEINVLSQEPQGFVNRTDSTISFNDATRTFTIQPAVSGGSYTIYAEGIKVVKSGIETVVLGSGTALNYIHFDTTPPYTLHTKTTGFNFDTDIPIAFIHWNADINQSTFFGEERHGIRMDSVTHKWIHNTFGVQYISGLSIGGYVLLGDGSSNSHAQIDISDGILYQEDIIVNIADDNGTNSANEFVQPLSPIAYIPVYYHSGLTGQWVRDVATTFPIKYNATRAQYNLYSGGTWTTPNVTNNRYFAMWIVATNDMNDPILAIMGQREDASLTAAESNNNWSDINLTNIPTQELRPLYRLIFVTNDTFTNTPKSSLQSILDIRVAIQSTVGGVTQNDHGSLFGLADDDHPQYAHIDNNRTISAVHTFANGLVASGLISAASGNFTTLQVNGTGVSLAGHTHTASNITDFNTAVSGLVSGVYQPLLTDPVTGTGTANYISKFNSSSTIGDSLIYDDGTNIGIGTSSPENLVHISGDASANSIFRVGSLEFQPYALNNAWVGENVYFNGSDFIRRQTGAAGLFYFQGNEGQFRFSNSDSAGTPISNNPVWKILSDGSMGVGTGLDYTTGSLAGASFKIASNGGVAVKDDIYGYVSAGIHRMQVVCDDSSTTGPLVLIGGNAGVEMWKDSTPSKAASFGMAIPGNTATDDLYISLYDGGSWNPRLFIQNSDGNIGINTTSPTEKLEVNGNIKSSGLIINGDGMSINTFLGGRSWIGSSDNNLGIGFDAVTNSLFGIQQDGFSLNGYNSAVSTYNSLTLTAGYFPQLYLDTNGNIGIQTAVPNYTLHVTGSGNFSDSLFVNDVAVSVSGHTHASSDITDFNTAVSGLVSGIYQPILTNPVTGTGIINHIAYWDSSSGIAADSGQLVWDSSNNRLGVGVASPIAPLDIGSGGAKIGGTSDVNPGSGSELVLSNTATAGMVFQHNGNNTVYIRSNPTNLRIGNNAGDAIAMTHSSRNVGIGTSSPTAALHVVGTSGIRVGSSSSNSYIYGPSGNAHIHLNQGTNNILLNSNTYANSSVSINTQTTNLNNASVNVNGTLQFPKTGTATSTATQKDPNLVRFFHSFWNGTSSYDGYNDIRSIVSTTVNQQSRLGFLINNGDGTQNLTERLSISSSGNIGINKTAPTVALDVVGNANISGTLTLLSDVFTLSNNKTIAASGDAGTKGNICWDNNYLYICVDNNNWKRISYDSW